MATINHGSGADIIVPSNTGTTYRGLAGDDTYIISNSIAANANVTIVDTSGANKIQLVDGLSVKSSKFAADAVQLTLSNGAVVTINGASNFTFDVGGNATTGTSGSSNSLAQFASAMGVATLPSSGSTDGSSDITIANNGVSGSAAPTFTVSKSGSSVDEGSSITYTITASSAVSADTSFSWTVIGDSNGATVDKAGASDIDVLSGTATIAAGGTSTTFDVTASSDSVVEGIEGIKVSVFDSNSTALSSSVILVNNSGSSATSQAFTLTTGVNEFVGGSGNDNFDASTTANSLNDFDALDGGDGTDTVTAKLTAADAASSVTPLLNNIENLSVTYTDTTPNDGDLLTVNLAEATSIASISNITSNDNASFTNVGSVVHYTAKSAQGTQTIEYDLAALAGTADNMTISVKGTNNTTITLDDDNPANTSVLETVTVESLSVANTLAALNTALVNTTTLAVTGDKKLTITAALDADIATIDASGSSGGLTLTNAPGSLAPTVIGSSGADAITVGTANVNISGGAGNDTLTAAGTWNGSDVYDGGDGTDTLAITSSFEPLNTGPTSANTIAAGLSNVEKLVMTGAATTVSFDKPMGALSIIDISDTNVQTVNLNDGYTGATTVYLGSTTSANMDANEKIVNTAGVDLTIYANVSTIDGDTNNKTTITGGAGTDTLMLYNIGADENGNGDGAANNTAVALLGDGNNNNITGVDKIVIIDVVTGMDPEIDTGDYALTNALGAAIPLTIDGSQLDAGEDLTTGRGGSSLAKMNVIGGAGNDSLTGGTLGDTLSGGAGNDTIIGTQGSNVLEGGAGNDAITLGTGAENISGGAGNDTFTLGGNLQLTDTLDGGDGTDTLVTGNITSHTIFGGVSNIEVIKVSGDGIDITAAADLGGATTFDLSGDGQNELTLTSTATTAWTADTTVTFGATEDSGGNDDKIVNSANVTLTVSGRDDDFDAATTITGGTGTDTLKITATGDLTGANLGAVTNVEKVDVVDAVTAGTDIVITPNLTTLKSTIIDGTALDGSVQNDETLKVLGDTAAGTLDLRGGGGQDSLYGGAKNDTIDGGAGVDSLDGNGGADHITGGSGNDKITIGSKAEFISAVGADTVDGGVGVDTVVWTGAMTMAATQLGSISNTEVWSIAAGSDFTISDDVLANNPGIVFAYAGNGTLSGGEDTAGAALMTSAITWSGSAAGNMKLIGSSADDSYTFNATATLTVDDTIDGNAGTDTLFLNNNTSPGGADGTGNSVTAGFDADVKGIEKIVVNDLAVDYGGDIAITITNGYLDTALTIDATALDVDPTAEATGETLTVTNNDTNVKLTVLGGAARDTITGNGGADSLVGNGAADQLNGGGGNDTIEGGPGNDALNGGAGADHISGGDGIDTITVSTYTDFKTSGGVETVDGGAGIDTLAFAQNDTGLALTAPELSEISNIESITIASGTGTATMTFGNSFFEGLGATSITITSNTGSGVTTIDGSAVSNGSFLIINDIGADTADKYVGGSGDDIFRFDGTAGLKANDTVTGGLGNDIVQLDASAANVTATLDLDTTSVEKVVVYAGATGINAGAVDLRLDENGTAALNAYTGTGLEIDMTAIVNTGVAGAKVNYVESGNGQYDETLDIGDAAILVPLTIHGSGLADTLHGSGGNDTISGNSTLTADKIQGGAGNDNITAGGGADSLMGGTGNDNITAGGGNDTILGGAGNDTIDGGDGVDTITGDTGVDTITTGLGNDNVKYTAVAQSTGSNKDVIKDFTQSTLNAVTGVTTTAGDNIVIDFGTLADNAVLTLSDKGDVANAGLATSTLDGVKGSFVWADDTATLYVDVNGDNLLNTNDYQITLEGLTSFHSNDINIIVTAGAQGESVTGAMGDDTITGGAGADTLTGGGGNDVIAGAGGGDSIYGNGGNDLLSDLAGDTSISGGAGDDTIMGSAADQTTMTGGTGDDTFNLTLTPINDKTDRETITDFENAGDVVGDVIVLEGSETTVTTADGAAPVFATLSTAADAGANPAAIAGSPNINTFDVLEITVSNNANVNMSADFADGTGTGANLVKNIGAANDENATGITVNTAAHEFYIIAYDQGNAYIYHANNANGNNIILPAEISAVATVTGVTAGAFVAEDFLLG